MSAIGGSILEITLRGRIFAVVSDAGAQRKLGGFENQIAPNGNGTVRTIKTRVAWDLSGLQVEVDDARNDQEFLQELSDSNAYVPVSMKLASNLIYQAQGTVHGEIAYDTQNATATINVGGPGKMGQQ